MFHRYYATAPTTIAAMPGLAQTSGGGGGPSEASKAAGPVDGRLLAIQRDLYRTPFYKGRTDGRQGDEERMTDAILYVQIAAGLPETGVYDDAVRNAIAAYVRELRWPSPTTTTPPVTPPPIAHLKIKPTGVAGEPAKTPAWKPLLAVGALAVTGALAWRWYAATKSTRRSPLSKGRRR